MDIETTPTDSSIAPSKKGQTPWGVIIAILLILVIIVSGAYYAFTERITPTPAAAGAALDSTY
ncbi:MAG: hypothetical protein JWN90_379 [Parcubacteria group bacterium]|nr:hypothetical protein [Parcubacteria group bacterium]